jgi:GR25 family glycosyltransferase involved in LPS biosynthesis
MIEHILKKFKDTGEIKTVIESLKLCEKENNYEIGILISEYFLEIFIDNIDILEYYGSFCYNTAKYRLSHNIFEKLICKNQKISMEKMEFYISMKSKCIDHIKDDFIGYNKTLIKKLSKENKPHSLITLTMTTCKRLSLFIDTINSFLNCCQDVHLIDRWILIDDNSTEEDRKIMKEKYPFFEFVFKDKKDKGHPRSMNMFLDLVETPYMFHMEDDWKFIEKRNYMTECLNVLSTNNDIGQCLINRNYGETSKDNSIPGGYHYMTQNGLKYVIHEHCSTDKQYEEFNKKHNNRPNCAYWPHFSFRPSLIRTSVFKNLGRFDEKVSHFEMEYSRRYIQRNYISAFLNGIFCLHTGRLTSEINDETKLNAYKLNNEKQFSGKEQENNNIQVKDIDFKTFVINLDRREDRWENIKKLLDIPITRFSAIDGRKLKKTEQLQRIFDGNDYNMRDGMVGCALSHIKLCIDLLYSPTDNIYCILEDDIVPVPDFKKKLQHLYAILPNDWEFCYLGCHLWKQYQTDEFLNKSRFPVCERWSSQKSLMYSIGGTGGYLINKTGAYKLLEYINACGMTNCIDTVQQKASDYVNVYYTKPHLYTSDCYTNNNSVDSDVSNDNKYISLTMDIEDRIKEELKKYNNPILTSDYNYTEMYIKNLENKNTLFFVSQNREDFVKILSQNILRIPFYIMGKTVIVFVPKEKILYPFRLNKGDNYDITDAIQFISNDMTYICLGDNYYIGENIIEQAGNEIFPFDYVSGINFYKNLEHIFNIVLEWEEQDMENWAKKFCQYNSNKTFYNKGWDINIKIDCIDDIENTYVKRFKLLKSTILSGRKITFVYGSRWCRTDINYDVYLKSFLSYVSKYNANIQLLCINVNIKPEHNIIVKNVDYPAKFQNDDVDLEKIIYDRDIYKKSVKKCIY